MIRVVTDSASDLPHELLEHLAIRTVPLEVRLGSLDPASLIDVDPMRFWELAKTTNALAETSAPSPGAFKKAFEEAADDGCEGVICITISSSLSATFQSALQGAAEVTSQIEVEVVDSRLATMGEGLLVLDAVELAASGATAKSIGASLRQTVDKISVLGTLDTLDALRRGGRIGSAQAFIGSMLSIKPVVEVRDGVVEGESRQRTRQRSFRYLADKVLAAGPLKRLAVVHAAAEDLSNFLALLADAKSEHEIMIGGIGPVIGAHTGLGTVGVCFEHASGAQPIPTAVTS